MISRRAAAIMVVLVLAWIVGLATASYLEHRSIERARPSEPTTMWGLVDTSDMRWVPVPPPPGAKSSSYQCMALVENYLIQTSQTVWGVTCGEGIIDAAR